MLEIAAFDTIKRGVDCVRVVVDDVRYGPNTLALIRKDIADFIGPCGTMSMDLSHRRPGLQIADVIANTFFNRATATKRQGQMAAIVGPFLEITLKALSGDTESD